MRISLFLSLLLSLGACGDDVPAVECEQDENCGTRPGGQCTEAPSGNFWCTYPDVSCEDSGRVWSELAGDGLADMCVGADAVDAGVDAPVADAMADAGTVDGRPDATPPPDGAPGTWSDPSEILNLVGDLKYPGISPDGLSLYISIDRDIHVATRASTALPFEDAAPIAILNTVDDSERDVEISANNLEMLFVRAPNGSLSMKIMRSTRGSPAAAWSSPTDTGIFGVSPSLSDDGLTLYYLEPGKSNLVGFKRVTRPSLTDSFGTPQDVAAVTAGQYFSADVSPDQLQVLLSSRASTDTSDPPLLLGTRSSTSEPFGNFVEIPQLDVGLTLREASFNQEALEIYYSAIVTTDSDIWVSTFIQ